MQHTWDEKNKCKRCGIVKEERSERLPNPFDSGYFIRHYINYYVNGYLVAYRPKCYYPGQMKLVFP